MAPTTTVWFSARARLAVVIAAGALLVATGGVLTAWNIRRFDASAAGVAQTLEILNQSQEILQTIAEVESASRGFLLTGDAREAARFEAVAATVAGKLELVRSRAARSTAQLERWRHVEGLVDERVAFAQRLMALHRSDPPGAAALLQSGRGRELTVQIGARVRGFQEAERALLLARETEQGASLHRSLWATAGTAGAGILLVGLAGWAVARENRRRTRAAQELEAALASLRATTEERDRFFSMSLDILCIANPDGTFRYVSPAATGILGWRPEEMAGRPFMEFVHPDDQASTLREWERLTKAHQPVLRFENRYRHKDGGWRVLSWKSVSEPAGLTYAIARDVTEQHEADDALRAAKAEAEQANRAKSQFLANMSHELRTPMNAIIGFSEMLEDGAAGPLTPKQARYVSNILASGRHLLDLINDILDLAKVESGKLELLPERLHLGQVISDVLTVVRSLAQKKAVALTADVAPDLPPLWADAAKVKQVLYNLLSNAVKFTPDGGTVTVRASHHEDRVRVDVCDTGIGIRPADHARVWREFEQIDSSYARAQQGTGLGLALTKRLVELHGGRIWLESEGVEGRGTTFTVELPVGSPPANGADKTPVPRQAAARSVGPGERPLVLVVEDDEKALGLLDDYLRSGGYDVVEARSAAEALERALALSPFAITLDILLPDRPGWELVKDLKAEPRTRDIPIVVVSITDDKPIAESLGVVEFLVKPVGRQQLLRAVDRVTSARE